MGEGLEGSCTVWKQPKGRNLTQKLFGINSWRTVRLMEEKRGSYDLWAEGRVLSYLHNLFITVCSASSTKDVDTGRFKCSPWEEWIRLFELSQRLPTSPGAFLSPSMTFGSSTGAGAASSRALILYLCRGEAEHSHIQPTAAPLSFSFIFVFTLHVVPKLSDSARSGNIPSTTISYETLSHAFDCLSLFRAILFCRRTER